MDLGQVDLNIADKFGHSPLWYVSRYHHTGILQLLVGIAMKRGISLSDEKQSDRDVATSWSNKKSSPYCDVCTLYTQENRTFIIAISVMEEILTFIQNVFRMVRVAWERIIHMR